MSSPVLQPRLTAEEYLVLERAAEFKSEFINGEMYAMAGGSGRHSRLAANLIIAIGIRLRGGPCQTYTSDQRVNISATRAYTYPDVTVVCGEPHYAEDGHEDTLLNPTALIEVLSPSTEAYDRGAKFAHYQRIESLREYVLVAQDQPRVEHFARRPADGPTAWLLTVATGLNARLLLPALGVELPLTEIYEGVRFEAANSPAAGANGQAEIP